MKNFLSDRMQVLIRWIYRRKQTLACRSLGDGDLKGCGVIAVPEVSHTILTPGDSCLVIASDGLWDRISSQAAVDLIRDTVKDPTMCAQRLATEAITLGSGGHQPMILSYDLSSDLYNMPS